MTSRSTLYGLVVVAVALILITATVAGYYYVQYSNSSSDNSQLTSELNGANANYSTLASNFNVLLAKYNQSIYLLSSSIAVMNTSLPAYRQDVAQLSALWAVYQSLTPASKSLLHNSVYFDFGNGTRRWYNGTAINAGWNLYVETLVLMKGQIVGTWYPSLGAHFITSIGGLSNSATEYWFLWTYNKSASWQVAGIGADEVLATSGSVYAWTYCGADANFNPTCTPRMPTE
jgi:hypothetical protein